MARCTLLVSLLLAVSAAPAIADEGSLPLGLSWCDGRAALDSKLGDVKELSGDMLEAGTAVWGLDGFATATLESGKLVALRLRFFQSDKALRTVQDELQRGWGEGFVGTRATTWQRGNMGISLKTVSEQIYVQYEIPMEACATGAAPSMELTAQQKADLEAVAHKKAIEFDPYADSDDPEQKIIEKPVDEEKKKKAEEKKEADKKVDDTDIDW